MSIRNQSTYIAKAEFKLEKQRHQKTIDSKKQTDTKSCLLFSTKGHLDSKGDKRKYLIIEFWNRGLRKINVKKLDRGYTAYLNF